MTSRTTRGQAQPPSERTLWSVEVSHETRLLARAYRALLDEGTLDVEPFLGSLRQQPTTGARNAAADVVDVGAFAPLVERAGNAALAARAIRAERLPFRSGARAHLNADMLALTTTPGDAFAWALMLGLEGAKAAFALPAAVTDGGAAPDAESARAALAEGGAARTLNLDATPAPGGGVDSALLAALAGSRPVTVVCGAGALRMHDMLSPAPRRLKQELAALTQSGRETRASPDDDAYAAWARVEGKSHDAILERLVTERTDGLTLCGDAALVARLDVVPIALVDRRAKDAVARSQRQGHALVLVGEDPGALQEVLSTLGDAIRAVVVLTEGTVAQKPDAVADPATGHVTRIENGFGGDGVLISMPSLALVPLHDPRPFDAAAFALVQAVDRARAERRLDRRATLAVAAYPRTDQGWLSQLCLDVLVRQSPPARAPEPTGRGARPSRAPRMPRP